jgi:hypothetical protein
MLCLLVCYQLMQGILLEWRWGIDICKAENVNILLPVSEVYLVGMFHSRSDAERSATDRVGDDQWPSTTCLVDKDYT